MKKTFILLAAAAFVALSCSALLGADTRDTMVKKITNSGPSTLDTPLAIASNALVSKDNTILLSAYGGTLSVEGDTNDNYETALAFTDPTADRTVRFANASGTVFLSSLATNAPDVANSLWGASNGLVFEGSTADAYELTLAPADVTADRTATLPNASGTVHLSQASTAVSLTADNQAVTPGSSTVIQLSSDDATSTNRTFTLSATGAITGQIYVIIAPATNACEIADTGIQKLSATWTSTADDTLTLLFDGTNFIELTRAAN